MNENYFIGIEDKTANEGNFEIFGVGNAKEGQEFTLVLVKREQGKVYFNLKPYGKPKKRKKAK